MTFRPGPAACNRLPEVHRNVLLLRDIEELGTEESAAMRDIEAETVKVGLHRARQAPRTLLHDPFADEST